MVAMATTLEGSKKNYLQIVHLQPEFYQLSKFGKDRSSRC